MCYNEDSSNITINTPKRLPHKRPKKCNQKNCANCQNFNPSNKFSSTITKENFYINENFTCNSENVIYLITCTVCRKQYVGKTSKPLRQRLSRQKSTINTKKKRYISLHFNLPFHSATNISIQIIDAATTPQKLTNLEKFWIEKLHTD